MCFLWENVCFVFLWNILLKCVTILSQKPQTSSNPPYPQRHRLISVVTRVVQQTGHCDCLAGAGSCQFAEVDLLLFHGSCIICIILESTLFGFRFLFIVASTDC